MKITPQLSLDLGNNALGKGQSRPAFKRGMSWLAAGLALLASVSARAQTWDPLHNLTGSDGAGVWDTNTFNWASSGADILWPNTASVATIGSGTGAAGIITLSSGTVITNSGITFNAAGSGAYTLFGGTNYLGGATPTVTVNSGSATIDSALQGATGLTTAGAGTLVLGGTDTYTGNTSVGQGTLKLTNYSGFPSVLPLVYMSFTNVTGTTVVNQGSGGSAMNGTLSGGASITAGAGQFGHGALSIPSGSESAGGVLINNAVVPLTGSSSGNWTVAMWIKTSTAGGTYFYQGSGGWVSGNTQFYLQNGTQGDPAGTHQGGVRNSQGWLSGTGAVNDGNWHFLVMTMNAGTKAMYLDGTNDVINNGTGSWTGTGVGTQVEIGGTPSGAEGGGPVALNGLISEVSIYNVALNQAQVDLIMTNSSVPALPAGPQLPPATSVTVASGATLDLDGQNSTVSGLSGAGVVTSTGNNATLTITNATAQIFSGSIQNGAGLGLVKGGVGALTLSGANTFQGPSTVNVGTLNITGSLESFNSTASTFTIGGATGNTNTVVNFSGSFWTNYELQLGVLSGQNAALYQTSGITAVSVGASGSAVQIGNAVGANGYYYLGAGATLVCGEIGVAGEGNSVAGSTAGAGNGLMEVNGGTVIDSGYVVVSRLASGTQAAVVNIYPGSSFNFGTTNGGGFELNWGTAGTSVVNMMGGFLGTPINVPINLNENNNAGNIGILNLNGGNTQVSFVNGGANNTYVNFNGGTLSANENQGTFMSGLKAAYVFAPGGTINNNGFNITINQPFISPTTNGIHGITGFTLGAGYIFPPIVTVVRGTGDTTGVDATAIAQIDASTGGATSGMVTNVLITCPGVNYTATPTFTLTGGGATTAATITGAAPTANTTGNLTFSGSGITVLTGPLTFAGNAIVSQGTLQVIGAGQVDSTPIVVNDGASLIEVPLAAGVFTPATVTVGSTTGGTLGVTASSTAQPALTIANLNLVGTAKIQIFGNLVAGNTYSLLAYTNLTGSLSSANFALPNGVGGTVTSAPAGGETIWSLAVTAVTNTVWKGAINGTWDVTTANWFAPNGGSTYVTDSPVQFDDLSSDNTGNIYVITNVTALPLFPSTVLVSNAVNNYTFSNTVVISGGGGITKDGAASLTNFGPSTYTGPTVIKAGSLVAGVATSANVSSAIGNNSPVILSNVASASLNLNNNSTQIGSLSGGGTTGGNVILGSGRLTVGADNSSQNFAGVISGTGGLTQIGTGNQTLSGVNLFTGTIGGIAGTLTIGGAGQLNGGIYAGTITDAGVFNYNSSAVQTNTAIMSGAGALVVNGSGILNLTALNTYTGGTTVNNGATLALRNGGATAVIRGPLTINPGGTVNAYNTDALGYNSTTVVINPITNNGGVFNDQVTGGNEGYLTQWYLQGGTVAAPGNGAINMNGTGFTTLATNVSSVISANIDERSSNLGFTNALGTVPGGVDLLVSGLIQNVGGGGNGAIVKAGPGTTAFSAQDVSGTPSGINIVAGTLVLADPGYFASGFLFAPLTDNGTFVDASSSAQLIGGVISGSGGVVITNPSAALTLTNVDTYVGKTVVGGGTLYLTGSASISASTNIIVTNGGTFDVSQLTSGNYTMGPNQSLIASNSSGSHAVNGSITTSSGSQIYPGGTNAVGTLTFNNSLTLNSGTTVGMDLSTLSTTDGGNNDQIIVNGALTVGGGNSIVLNGLGGAANLDQSSDYVLVTGATSFTGGFNNGPIWTGTVPANFNHFIVTNDVTHNQVRLTYSAVAVPSISTAVTTPSTGILRNQTILVSVTVIPGQASITGVTINLSSVGGASSTPLTLSSTPNVWTNSVSIPAGTPAGTVLLPVAATDANSNQGAGTLAVAVVSSVETWNGGGTAGQENFDNNANWAIESGETAAYAPGFVGDTLVFAGLGGTAGFAPVMDNSYTVAGVSFSSGATNFNITPANSSTLTLNGGITNSSTNLQTLAVPITMNTTENISPGTGGLALSGVVSGATSAVGLVVNGPGTLTLSGNDPYTGQTLINNGTLNVTSTGALGSNNLIMLVGNNTSANSNSVVKMAGTMSAAQIWIGNFTNQAAAFYQTGSSSSVTLNPTPATGVDNISVGNVGGAYGYYNAAGGTLVANGMAIAGEGAQTLNATPEGNGIMDVNGTAISDLGWVVMCRSSGAITNQTGIFNLYSGSVTYAGGGFVVNWGSIQTSMINIMGGALYNTAQEPINLNESGNGANTGILNLIGGYAQADSVIGAAGALNFNGGALAPSENIGNFINTGSATIYANGGTITNSGYSITIAQPFIPPAGNGLASVTTFTGGAGYIAPPIVIITNGGGTGATALAQINPATGIVTNVLITCPGNNYTNTPTFLFSGGGATTQATVSAVALAPNTSGPMQFIGSGTVVLTGGSSYTNVTIVNQTDLQLGAGGSITHSYGVLVTNGGNFDLSLLTGFTLASGQRFEGGGGFITAPTGGSTVTGPGSSIYPGTDGTIGSLTFNGALSLAAGSTANFDLSTSASSGNDSVNVTGNLILNGNTLHIKAPSTSSSLDTTSDYVLFNASSVIGSFALTPVFDVAPVNAANYRVLTVGGQVVLRYSTQVPPTGGGTATPTNAVRNGTVFVSVTVTNGGSAVNGVTVDTSLLGGSSGQSLVEVGSTTTYTNTFAVAPTTLPGAIDLTATITDSANQIGVAFIPVAVVATAETWDGANRTTDLNWDDGKNWVSTIAPGYVGDTLIFAGANGLTPFMDQTYSPSNITFAAGASAFILTNNGGNALTMTTGSSVTNNSATTETIGLQVNLSGPVSLNAVAGSIVMSQSIGELVTGAGAIVSAGPGTNILLGYNTYTGSTTISSGTLLIGSNAVLNGGTYAAGISDNGTLAYDSTSVQTLSGAIGGSGALVVNGPPGGTGVLNLTAAGSFTGNITVSNATLIDTVNENVANPVVGGFGNPRIAGRTVTVGTGGLIQLSSSGGNEFGTGNNTPVLGFVMNPGGTLQVTVGNVTVSNLTFNGGTLLCNANTFGFEYEPWELGGSVIVGGTVPSVITNTFDGPDSGMNLGVGVTTGQTIFNVNATGAAAPDLAVGIPLVDAGGVAVGTAVTGLIKAGNGTMLVTDQNLYHGVTTLSNGVLSLGSLETPGTSGPMGISAASSPGSIVFSGGTLQYSSVNQNDYSGRFSTAANDLVSIDTAGQTITFATGVAGSGSGLAVSNSTGNGTLTTTATNSYTGPTTVGKGGRLIVSSTGSISNTSNINIGAGGTLDVTSQANFNLATNGSITGSGTATTANFAGQAINFGSHPITLNYDGTHPALTISSGTLTLNGNAFIINSSSPLGVGNYIILQQSSGSIVSSGNYTVSGTAIAGADGGTITVSGGTVTLHIAVVAPPTITFNVTGGNTLNISWPSAYLGAALLYESNSLNTGLVTNASAWVVYPGSTSVTSEAITIGQTNEVFFRLNYP